MSGLGVGSTIWRFDGNRRVYTRPADSKWGGTIIYREHWEPRKIVGETGRSWIVEGFERWKAPKKGAHPGWAFSEREVDLDVFAHEHRHPILEAVRRASPEQLIQVGRLLGLDLPWPSLWPTEASR